MSQYTSFKIIKNTAGSAAEAISLSGGKIRKLADSLTAVQAGLNGTTESMNMMGSAVKSLQEKLVYQSEKVERLGSTAAWCCGRYENSERALLGLPLKELKEIKNITNVPKDSPYSLEMIRSAAQKELEARKKKDADKPKETKKQVVRKWVENYRKDKKGWDPTWTYSDKSTKYEKALVEYTTENGVTTEKVIDHTGTVKDGGSSVAFFSVTSRKPLVGTILGDIEMDVNENRGYNYFNNKNDYRKDYQRRVYEKRDDPDKPGKKKLTLMTPEEEKQKRFARDIISVNVVEWEKSASVSLKSGEKTSEGDHHELGASYSLLSAEAHAKANVGSHIVQKGGKIYHAYGANVEAGASATVFKAAGKAKAKLAAGDFDFLAATAQGEVKAGHVEGTGAARARWIREKGWEGLDVSAEGNIGAYAATASASGAATVLGVSARATAQVNVGIGASGKVGLSGGKLRCELGLTLGVGFKVGFEIDVSGAVNGIKKVVNTVGPAVVDGAKVVGKVVSEGAKVVGNAVVSGAKAVGNAVADGAKAVGRFFSKW